MNRNRIRATNREGWSYLTVPIRKAPQSTRIQDIEISYTDNWQRRLKLTIERIYSKADHFQRFMPLLDTLWTNHRRLETLTTQLLKDISAYLGFSPHWIKSSELIQKTRVEPITSGRDRILSLCAALNATTYWNLPGGRSLYQEDDFLENGVQLRFVPRIDLARLQRRFPNANDLSILDLAMWHSPTDLRQMINALFDDD